MTFVTRTLAIFFLLFNISYALPFNIIPKAGTVLPTSLIQGNTVMAYYTVTNKTGSTRRNNFVEYLPPNVTQITENGTYGDTCTSLFTLNSGASCTLQLQVTGAINQNDPNPQHHLIVCFPGGITCAGTQYSLNVQMLPRYTITPSAGGNGNITPNSPQVVTTNGSATFTANPAFGYGTLQWLVDGKPAQTGGPTYTLNNINTNHTVQVVFKLITPWIFPNGTIYKIIHDTVHNLIYIGGFFNYIGIGTGTAVPFDIKTGSIPSAFPQVLGEVRTIISDNQGGWYIGGDFTSISGIPINYIAHIKSDLTLDRNFNVTVNNTVRALTLNGNVLYIGGGFTNINGTARNYIGAIDITNNLVTSWNPNSNDYIYVLTVNNGLLYAAGDFSSIGGQSRNYLAAIDITTGLATSWNPNPNSNVNAILFDNGIAYAGGSFTNIGGQNRNRLAAINLNNNTATSWNPNVAGIVQALAIKDGIIYVGGTFTSIGGQSRSRIASVDMNTGIVTSWNPNSNDYVLALNIINNTLYAGGPFTNIGNQSRNYIAAIDINSGQATSFNLNLGQVSTNQVSKIASDSNTVYLGGRLSAYGGKNINNFVALDATTGAPNNWNLNLDSSVIDMKLINNTLYLGGGFSSLLGQTRNNAGAIDTNTGLITSWNPNTNDIVRSLIYDSINNIVYLGGYFTTVGGQNRNLVAAVDNNTGAVTSWNPSASGTVVFALALNGNTLYTGGSFTSIGGQSRNNIAAINTSTGLASSWNPSANDTVRALLFNNNLVYAGGDFTSIASQSIRYLAVLDATNGQPTGLTATLNNAVYNLLINDNLLYLCGNFTTVNSQSRNRLAAININSSLLDTLSLSFSSNTVWSMDIIGNALNIGGSFTSFQNLPIQGFAMYSST